MDATAEREVPQPKQSVDELLTSIERHVASIEATVEILMASKVIKDGWAQTWGEALIIARDPEKLAKIYPWAYREATS